MKSNNNPEKGRNMTKSIYSRAFKLFSITALLLTTTQIRVNAQAITYSQPAWWFGVAGGANFNFYRGSTQELTPDIISPVPFQSGFGVGLYVAPLVEYHPVDSYFGFMFHAAYDNHQGTYKEVMAPCNCPRDLSTNVGYIALEPSLRFEPFKSNFYLFGGPRIEFNVENSFTYTQKNNPDGQDQTPIPVEKGNLDNMHKTLVSAQIGAGYDIQLSKPANKTKFVLSPFVAFLPYFGQSPRSIESWNITTLRAGLALKLGCGTLIPASLTTKLSDQANTPAHDKDGATNPKVHISINVPANIPVSRKAREVFPLRNYVFFNPGSTSIPDRYVALKPDQVKDFKEDQVELYTPSTMAGRSPRQMTVYYNVINILGDRMGKNPKSTIKLVGGSEIGPEDGKAMAETVKQYLVHVFKIKASRISVEGKNQPEIPADHDISAQDLISVHEGLRRVTIESGSQELLTEFQSGPDASLKPVEISDVEDAPVESYVTFNIGQGQDSFSSWSLEVRDVKGKLTNFGPYSQEMVGIPGKTILGNRTEGDFKIKIIGKYKSGNTVSYDTSIHIVLWTPPVDQELMRFSIIYEFNNAKAILIYEKYITEDVITKIPKNGKVIIHGYSDIIGNVGYNQKLSMARANDVKDIMVHGLAQAGRTDVKFEIYGFGSDQALSPFKNEFPEGRSYNRTVIIDIIPAR